MRSKMGDGGIRIGNARMDEEGGVGKWKINKSESSRKKIIEGRRKRRWRHTDRGIHDTRAIAVEIRYFLKKTGGKKAGFGGGRRFVTWHALKWRIPCRRWRMRVMLPMTSRRPRD